MTIDIDQIKREVGDKLSRLIPHSYSYNTMLNTIDYLNSRGYLGGAPEWQLIETAPRTGETIMIFDSYSDYKGIDGYGICTARWDYSLRWWIMHQRYSNVISLINPTHWQPLPAAPKGETK